VEYQVNLVIWWKLELICGYFGVSPDDFKGSNITIEELCIFSLSLDLDI
jgi:hypothetical protein